MEEVFIVHLSDLHVSSQHFSQELAENVKSYVGDLRPDVVVVTGDLTDEGYLHEYKAAISFLKQLRASRLLVVPGNHDSRNAGYVVFESLFGTRFPVLDLGWVKIQGVDSSEPDVDDGHIGRLAYELVAKNLGGFQGMKIVALHHHLLPVPGTGRERNIPVDAGDFLYVLLALRVGLVLSGHKHVPWLWNLNGMLLINAGTATTLRLKAWTPPSFNVVKVARDGEVEVKMVSSADLREALVYRGPVVVGGREELPPTWRPGTPENLLKALREALGSSGRRCSQGVEGSAPKM